MKLSLETYQFKSQEVIASIGAGGGLWEIGFASHHEYLIFYIQDIDEGLCNQEELNEGLAYFERQLGKKLTSTFIPVIGTAQHTHLPTNTFDKILLINTLHEFEYPSEMLGDIWDKLKQEGTLFIEEQLASYEGEIHEGCNKPLFTEIQLIKLLAEHHFVNSGITDRGTQVKIMAFNKSSEQEVTNEL